MELSVGKETISGGGIIRCSDPGNTLKAYPERKYIILHSVAPLGKTIMKIIADCKTETVKSRRAELRDERDKKILGDIIFGKYLGNGREPADGSGRSFFIHDGIYSGGNHRKVHNVKVYSTILGNVSKYFYAQNVDVIEEQLRDWHELYRAAKILDKIANPSADTMQAILLLRKAMAGTIESLQKTLLEKGK